MRMVMQSSMSFSFYTIADRRVARLIQKRNMIVERCKLRITAKVAERKRISRGLFIIRFA
jgi:hypothetical protein